MNNILLGFVVFVLGGLVGYHWLAKPQARQATLVPVAMPGLSGLAQISTNRYLAVSDTKKAYAKLFYLEFVDDKPPFSFQSVALNDPKQLLEQDPIKDLEAICQHPTDPTQYWLFESQRVKGKAGRALRVHWQQSSLHATVQDFVSLPKNFTKANAWSLEGVVCFLDDAGQFTLLLSERGALGPGKLLKAVIEKDQFQIQQDWSVDLKTIPGLGSRELREISELFMDQSGVVWTSATIDPDYRAGPFHSFLMSLGHIQAGVFQFQPEIASLVTIAGFKVEGLTAAPNKMNGEPVAQFLISTDDEALGGVLRVLN